MAIIFAKTYVKRLAIIMLCVMIVLSNMKAFANDGLIIQDSIKIKRQRLYFKRVYSSVDNLNKEYLKKIKLKDGEKIFNFVVNEEYDCKNYKYRYKTAKLYTNYNRVVSQEKDNSWHNDIAQEKIMNICETCYAIRQVRKKWKM